MSSSRTKLKELVFAASLRAESLNRKLAVLAARVAEHTRVEAFEHQIQEDANFNRLAAPIEHALTGRLPEARLL